MKIKSMRFLGKKQTFNIEMKSKNHNYVLRPIGGQPIHRNSHAVAYSVITYRCLWLKTHYPAEWWAAVMTECNQYKLGAYMSAARLDGVKFGTLDINALSNEYSVKDGKVIPGLMCIKGVGEKASVQFTSVPGPFESVDDVVAKCGRDKKVMERLIKLGAFDSVHPNRQGLWTWYQYKYCSGTDITALRQRIDQQVVAKLWPGNAIAEQKERFARDFLASNPKRKSIPPKILNWKPKIGYNYDTPTRDQVIDLCADFTPGELLEIEKELLGYYWSSPLELYHSEGYTIEDAKVDGVMDVVIESVIERRAKKTGNAFYVLHVTDGIQTADVTIWGDVYRSCDQRIFRQGVGVRMNVDYSKERKNFKIQNGTMLIPLQIKGEENKTAVPTEALDIW